MISLAFSHLASAGLVLRRGILLGVLLAGFTGTVRADTQYLFVPGHGLTNKSANPAITTEELIAECKDTGPWMRFVEREYAWKSLQADGAPGANQPGPYIVGTDARGRPIGISQIVADAKKCAAAGLKLRVMLMHKFAPIPAYLTRGQTYAVPITTINGRPAAYNIKLDRPEVLGFLEALYQRVIDEFKQPGNEAARDAFYGFIVQEHAFGNSPYWTAATRTQWVDNLIRFNQRLAAQLRDFAPGTPTPHRLFWQMVNSPTADALRIIDAMPAGGGLCGPDTFPREPGPGKEPGSPPRKSLYETYKKIRTKRGVLPISLHVYANNYWSPYVHGEKDVTAKGDKVPHLGPQPIWQQDTKNEIASYSEPGLGAPIDNLHAGVGIANFLGCVSLWAKKTVAEGGQGEPDNMQVNNVVWSFTTFVPEEAELQGYVAPKGKNRHDAYGWANVKAWMKNSTSDQFPNGRHTKPASPPDLAGGCTTTIPSTIAL